MDGRHTAALVLRLDPSDHLAAIRITGFDRDAPPKVRRGRCLAIQTQPDVLVLRVGTVAHPAFVGENRANVAVELRCRRTALRGNSGNAENRTRQQLKRTPRKDLHHRCLYWNSGQNTTLMASWTIRGELALVITPKVGLFTVWFGSPRFAWLKTLKNSPRNCKYARSVSPKFLNRE